MLNSRSRFLAEFGSAMVAYTALVALSVYILGPNPSGPWATLIVLLPMLPAAAMCWAVLRQLRRSDELQRRMQLEALGLAFAGTALITFSYGFLELVGWPKLSMFAVWPLMGALWLIGGFLASRRYR